MNAKRYLIPLLVCLFLFSGTAMAATFQSLGSHEAAKGQTISIPLTVDTSQGIAGAAFSVEFDSAIFLQPSVESTFFGTFETQFKAVNPNHTGPFVADDGTDQPVVYNVSSPGLKVAAARAQAAGADASKTLFTFKATISETANVDQAYTIRITPTTLNNTAAGYASTGEQIDLLIGADPNLEPSAEGAFPVLLSATAHNAAASAGQVTINSFVRGDVDGSGGPPDATDALYILHYDVGNIDSTQLKTSADMDCSGGDPDATDALYILHFDVGNITEFPICQ